MLAAFSSRDPSCILMIDIEASVSARFPRLANSPDLLRKPALMFLRHIVHETEINAFLSSNRDVSGLEWIDRVFERFNFSYSVSARERANIPASGRVVIIANHPIGSLDGLALLRLVGEIRQDVKIIANDLLNHFEQLQKLLIPIDVFTGGSALGSYRQVISELEDERAIIIFPAGEVSRVSPLGVKDPDWRGGFLHFARKAAAPILPIRIIARNSLLFYGASMLYKPISTMLLSDEMFKHEHNTITFHVGEMIPPARLFSEKILDRRLVKRLRKHVYKLGRSRPAVFVTEKTVAHPENRQHLQKELKQAQLLGTTRDNMAIHLVDWSEDSTVLREIGRLRELAFRKVGEGTGKRRDLDKFDQHYRHLVLWDKEALEIAGAYRIGECARLLANKGWPSLYTASLYEFAPAFTPYLEHSIELGRSFVNPDYWGKACLDYLWQGIGAYLAHHPDIRYLFGPVSMSAAYPAALMEELVFYFSKYYSGSRSLAKAHHPFVFSAGQFDNLQALYEGLSREAGFVRLQQSFDTLGHKIPVLYRQYAALFEEGGFKTLVFSRDPDFADCLDGLCMTDLSLLKANKRERYIPSRG
jgi:putative hemolysin